MGQHSAFSLLPIAAHHLDTVASTMDAAKEILKQPPPAGLVYVTARVQTAGRGTQGRVWQSPPGNLYMTCVVSLEALSEARLPTLPLEAGLVLHRLIVSRLPFEARPALWLKWPNDLLLQTGPVATKVAGMLIEVHRGHVLVGLGVNLAEGPEIDDGGRPAAGLAELSDALHPEKRLDIAEAFASGLAETLSPSWSTEKRRETIKAWSRITRWNEPVKLRGRSPGIPQADATVMPLQLTEQGHLEVRHADGRHETLVAEYLW
jgi:biotin-[acetyl-CoA-carboxylase] ligase BirA-like protein